MGVDHDDDDERDSVRLLIGCQMKAHLSSHGPQVMPRLVILMSVFNCNILYKANAGESGFGSCGNGGAN